MSLLCDASSPACESCVIQACEKTAQAMAKALTIPERKLAVFGSPSGTQLGRSGLLEELHRCSGAPDPTLVETLPKGVAYHHAGSPWADVWVLLGLGSSVLLSVFAVRGPCCLGL